VIATPHPRKESTMDVEFVYDYRSPYAYLADTQLPTLGAGILYKPVEILSVMKAGNNQPTPKCPPKQRYTALDAARWAEHYGVVLTRNSAFLQAMAAGRFDGALLLRVDLAARELGLFDSVHKALFEAVWASAADLTTEQGRKSFFGERGFEVDEVWRLASDPRIGELLARRDEEAAERGVFGVPTFFVGGEMFFGNDRLDFVRERLRGVGPEGVVA
jgi:2-hydroxychromene-2-carboxylate isomerase